MKTVEFNLVYPFWVKVPFLVHCYDRSKRMAYLAEWIKRINGSGAAMHEVLDGQETQARNSLSEVAKNDREQDDEEWVDRRNVAHTILRKFDWSLRDFRYEPKAFAGSEEVPASQELLLPVQIINHKGGILRGVLEIPMLETANYNKAEFISGSLDIDNAIPEKLAQSTSDAENHASGSEDDGEVASQDILNELKLVLQAHFDDAYAVYQKKGELKTIFQLDQVRIDIIYFDWNLGLLEFTFKMKASEVGVQKLAQDVADLSQSLSKLFSKKHVSLTEFTEYQKPYPNTIQKILANNERNGGFVHPRYHFFEDWLRLLCRLTPSGNGKDSKLETHPVVHRIFQGRLRKGDKHLGKTKEDYRMPFAGMNIIIGLGGSSTEAKVKSSEEKIDKEGLQNLIGSEGEPFDHILPPTIVQLDAGYNGNVLVYHGNPEKEARIHILRIWWIWRLSMIYYSGLLRIQNHLIARMGLQLPLENLAKDNTGLNEDSIHDEIERLETLQIAIEAVIQESLENNIGDDNLRRKLYRHILGEFRMMGLIEAVRVPIPKIVSDLRADLEKRKKEKEERKKEQEENRAQSLRRISSLTVFSVFFSGVSLIYAMTKGLYDFQQTATTKWISENVFPFFWISCSIFLFVSVFVLTYAKIAKQFLHTKKWPWAPFRDKHDPSIEPSQTESSSCSTSES